MLIVGRTGSALVGLMLTSKDHDRDHEQEARAGRHWMDVGTGGWDRQRRPSEVRLDRLLTIDPAEGTTRRRGPRPRHLPGRGLARLPHRPGRRRRSADDLVDVAPAPRLADLEAAHDRMGGLVEVRRGVLADRRVAAAHVAAGEAQPQVHPLPAQPQALLAALRACCGMTSLLAAARCSQAGVGFRGTRSWSRSRRSRDSPRSRTVSSTSMSPSATRSTSWATSALVPDLDQRAALGVDHLECAAASRPGSASRPPRRAAPRRRRPAPWNAARSRSRTCLLTPGPPPPRRAARCRRSPPSA